MEHIYSVLAIIAVVVIVAVFYVSRELRQAIHFMREANQYTRSRTSAVDEAYAEDQRRYRDDAAQRLRMEWEASHQDECARDLDVMFPGFINPVQVCDTCYKRIWKNDGATLIDKRGMPALKRTGPDGVPA